MTWYVAYSELPAPGASSGTGEQLKEFANEEAAKGFVKGKAENPRMRIRAGTLPGISPSIEIGPTDIRSWLKT